jgi:Dolichyl-phosphate-mannose-protein mannosyltransferase
VSWRVLLREYGGLALALGVGALCRFWDLTGQSFFIDEGFVFHVSSLPIHQMLMMIAYGDFHPPLFYLVTHYLMADLRWPLWYYRYLTAAFSLLGIVAVWAISRRFFGQLAAAIAALALALQPALIEWDRLYRMYAVLVALAALSWWLLVLAADSTGRKRWMWWLLYGLSAVALPYVQYVGAFVVLSQGVYALTRWRTLWPALVWDTVAAVALVPWLWAVRIQYPHGGLVFSLSSPEFSWPHVIRASLAYGIPAPWVIRPDFDLVVSIVAMALLLAGAYVARASIVPYWLAPIAVHVVASLATGKDLVIPRYLYVYVPAFCIAFGALCAAIAATKYRVGAVAIAALYFGVALVSVPNLLFVPYYQFPDWYQVNALLLAYERKTDLIVLDQGAEYWVVHDFSGFRGHQIDAPALPSDVKNTIRWLDGYPQRRVWYIENQPDFPDPHRRIEQYLSSLRTPLHQWRQNRIFKEDVVRIALYGPVRPAGKKRVVSTTSP